MIPLRHMHETYETIERTELTLCILMMAPSYFALNMRCVTQHDQIRASLAPAAARNVPRKLGSLCQGVM